jgi:hypothetical protein
VKFRAKATLGYLASVLFAASPLAGVNDSQNTLQALSKPGEERMKNPFHRIINLLAKPDFIDNIQLHLANNTIS